MSPVLRLLGPLAPAVVFFLVFAALFAVVRIALIVYYMPQVKDVDGLLQLLSVGLRIDTIVLCGLLSIPSLIAMLAPRFLAPFYNPVLAFYFTSIAAVFVIMEVASIPFLAEYTSRPNHLFFQYLAYPKEIFSTLWADFKWPLLIAAILIYFSVRTTWKLMSRLLHGHVQWGYAKRLLLFPVVLGALFIGARSGLGETPPNPSLAVFSNNHLANELALNSFYSLSYAIYRHFDNVTDAEAAYGRLSRDEILRRVKQNMLVPAEAFSDPRLPTAHAQRALMKREKPPNLVIIVAESLGADMVGVLGGRPLTPNFDRLSGQGILFDNLFAIGPRTARGLEAMVSGYLPFANHASLLKLGMAQQGFFTIADLLRRNGYHTGFIYGGESHFDNMSSFFIGNGFEELIDRRHFDHPAFESAWGVSDEDLFAKANDVFAGADDKPFFYLVLTLSNHRPHQFPDGRVPLYEKPKESPYNSAHYADYALGQFFKQAAKEDYFDNTIFLIVADHPFRPSGTHVVPVQQFRVPALILGPQITPRRVNKVASQIDLLPTVVSLMGLDTWHPMIGRNLLALPANEPGRAITQFHDAYAYRHGDDVVIYQPNTVPHQFVMQNGEMFPTESDPELVKDGLAHILLPGLLYREQIYRPVDRPNVPLFAQR